jgi:hypothetical protein
MSDTSRSQASSALRPQQPEFIDRHFPYFERQVTASLATGGFFVPLSIGLSLTMIIVAFLIIWAWPSTIGVQT